MTRKTESNKTKKSILPEPEIKAYADGSGWEAVFRVSGRITAFVQLVGGSMYIDSPRSVGHTASRQYLKLVKKWAEEAYSSIDKEFLQKHATIYNLENVDAPRGVYIRD